MLLLPRRLVLAFAGLASNANKSEIGTVSTVNFMSFSMLMLMLDDDWMARRRQFGADKFFCETGE